MSSSISRPQMRNQLNNLFGCSSLRLEQFLMVLVVGLCSWGAVRSYYSAMDQFEVDSAHRAERAAGVISTLLESQDLAGMGRIIRRGDRPWQTSGLLQSWLNTSMKLVEAQELGPLKVWFSSDAENRRAIAIGGVRRQKFGGVELPWTEEAIQSIRNRVPVATHSYQDQRDLWVTAYAPLHEKTGMAIGAVQVDYAIGREWAHLRAMLLWSWLTPFAIAGMIAFFIMGARRFRIPETEPVLSLPTSEEALVSALVPREVAESAPAESAPIESAIMEVVVTAPVVEVPLAPVVVVEVPIAPVVEVAPKTPPLLPPWQPRLDYFYNQFLDSLLLRSKAMRKSIRANSFSGGGIVLDGIKLRPIFQSLESALNSLIDKDIEWESERRATGKLPAASINFDAQSIENGEDNSQWLWLGISTDGRGVNLESSPELSELKQAVGQKGGTVDAGCRPGNGTWITLLLPLTA